MSEVIELYIPKTFTADRLFVTASFKYAGDGDQDTFRMYMKAEAKKGDK